MVRRLNLPTRSRPQSSSGYFDTWSRRARTLAAQTARHARTPHTIQLMPIRLTVVRPPRSFRGMIRSTLVDLALIGGTSAATYYLTRHPDQARAARRRIASTGRTMGVKLRRHTNAQHNGAGDRDAAVSAEHATV